MIAHVLDRDGKSYPVAYVVVRGELKEGVQKLGIQQLYEAELVIIVKDGSFHVFKDRSGEHGPVTFNEAWKRIESAAKAWRKHRNEKKNSKRIASQVTTTRRDLYMEDCFKDMA